MPKAIFLLGYQLTDIDKLSAWLELNDAVLCDIRISAYSKIPGWGYQDLIKRFNLYPKGRYIHIGEWGNENHGSAGASHKIVDFEAGWERVNKIRQTQRVVLMCGCNRAYGNDGNPVCHRATVANMIFELKGHESCGHIDSVVRRPKPNEDQQGLAI